MYKDIWTPTLGEKLSMAMEPENHHDICAVKDLKENKVVGHVSRDISKYCTTNVGMVLKSHLNAL